jgi:hypothetical protein
LLATTITLQYEGFALQNPALAPGSVMDIAGYLYNLE